MYRTYLPHFAIITVLALALIATYLGYTLWQKEAAYAKQNQLLDEYVSTAQSELALRQATIEDLAGRLELTSSELSDTQNRLQDEKERNDAIAEQVSGIVGTVNDLEKLSKTDEELLQKYSKVYFLNENYIPESLKQIDNEWKYTESKDLELHSKVMPFFEDMLEAAKEDGVDLWVVSAYRSFYTQAQLKSSYSVVYGSGANAFSADQGYSEHQLGTTIDFTTSGIGGGLDGFDNTAAYQWLLDNGYKYGFVLSYPEGNAYYVYEPWHWRFVGEDLARDLHKANAHFYDWDQRKIDEYLLHIFD